MDWQWAIGISLTLFVAMLALLGTFIAIWRKLGTIEKSIATSEATAKEAAAAGDRRLHERVDGVLESFATCRVDCAKNLQGFVTKDEQSRDFAEIKQDIRYIKERVDKFGERK